LEPPTSRLWAWRATSCSTPHLYFIETAITPQHKGEAMSQTAKVHKIQIRNKRHLSRRRPVMPYRLVPHPCVPWLLNGPDLVVAPVVNEPPDRAAVPAILELLGPGLGPAAPGPAAEVPGLLLAVERVDLAALPLLDALVVAYAEAPVVVQAILPVLALPARGDLLAVGEHLGV